MVTCRIVKDEEGSDVVDSDAVAAVVDLWQVDKAELMQVSTAVLSESYARRCPTLEHSTAAGAGVPLSLFSDEYEEASASGKSIQVSGLHGETCLQ